MRRIRLTQRLSPYLRDAPRRSRLLEDPLHPTLLPSLLPLLAPVLVALARRLDVLVGGAPSVRRRLDRCGNRLTVEQFRIEQVLSASVAGIVTLGLVGLALARGMRVTPVVAVVLPAVCAATAALARDRALSVEAHRREQRMLQEFPTIAELLALAVAAGEGAAGAAEPAAWPGTAGVAGALGRGPCGTPPGASAGGAADA